MAIAPQALPGRHKLDIFSHGTITAASPHPADPGGMGVSRPTRPPTLLRIGDALQGEPVRVLFGGEARAAI